MICNRLTASIVVLLVSTFVLAASFQAPTSVRTKIHALTTPSRRQPRCRAHEDVYDESDLNDKLGRRSFFGGISCILALYPQVALAAIDVSGLQVEGKGASNAVIASQLKSYDGSGASRVQEIKQLATPSAVGTAKSAATVNKPKDPNAATNAMRYTEPRVSRAGILTSRYEGQIVGPSSRPIFVSFEFPSDWLQLDKFVGGVQYVDQRNGDKLYLLRASLPPNVTLETVSKQWFGDVIFNPNGSFVKQVGNEVDEYKVSRSQVTTVPGGAAHRRVLLKFFTVTGNGLRVERRGLADVYQVENDVYMLVTSSNANKFEAKGKERDTVDSIVDSFRVERQ